MRRGAQRMMKTILMRVNVRDGGHHRMKVGQDNGANQARREYDLDADGHNGL